MKFSPEISFTNNSLATFELISFHQKLSTKIENTKTLMNTYVRTKKAANL